MLLFVILLSFLSLVAAHGYVDLLTANGKEYTTWQPYQDPSVNGGPPDRITRRYKDNGPIEDVTSDGIICNKADADQNAPAMLSAEVDAGNAVTFHWSTWPESHHGPVITYLAKCPEDDCTTFAASKEDGDIWFKIDEAGTTGKLAADNKPEFGSDSIVKTLKYDVTIPKQLKAGAYIIRHEIIALHSAPAYQAYPSCHNLIISSEGTEEPSSKFLVAFPGAYAASDPGLDLNINGGLIDYVIPGPPVWPAGSATIAQSQKSDTEQPDAKDNAKTEDALTSTEDAASATSSSSSKVSDTSGKEKGTSSSRAIVTPSMTPAKQQKAQEDASSSSKEASARTTNDVDVKEPGREVEMSSGFAKRGYAMLFVGLAVVGSLACVM